MSEESHDMLENTEETIEAPLEPEAPSALSWKKIIAVVAIILVIFAGGWLLGNAGWPFEYTSNAGDYSELSRRIDEVAGYLDSDSISEIDVDEATSEVMDAIICCMGDKYAKYFNKSEFSSYQMRLDGSFMGIEVSITSVSNGVLVTGVYKGSAAEKAGVKPGDTVVSIDGKDGSETKSGQWTAEDVVEAIRREEGESVEIVWNRMGEDDLAHAFENGETAKDFVIVEGEKISTSMVYAEVDIEDGTYSMIGDIGYISLYTFDSGASVFVKDALTSLMDDGAKSIILDLRYNGGGYLTQAVKIVSMFVSDGVVVTYDRKGKSESAHLDATGDKICDLPLAILVNDQSASASEVASCALRDHVGAKLIGTKTYGKGTVQDIRSLSFGGGIKFTIAHYNGPDGEQIDGVGLEPDIEVGNVSVDNLRTPGSDAQLDAAIEYLHSL